MITDNFDCERIHLRMDQKCLNIHHPYVLCH